jgi:hypothetical protein
MLQSSLAASHQRIVALTADVSLDSSTSSQPLTPSKDFADLPATDGLTPLSDIGAIGEEDDLGEAASDGIMGEVLRSTGCSYRRRGRLWTHPRSVSSKRQAKQELDTALATQQLEL